jgi:hypothetical protein
LDFSFCSDPGNGFNQLYAQLLGAKLNIADGASPSAIAVNISGADAFLDDHTCGDWDTLSPADQAMVLSWAATFDEYNNGTIGPGHCVMGNLRSR